MRGVDEVKSVEEKTPGLKSEKKRILERVRKHAEKSDSNRLQRRKSPGKTAETTKKALGKSVRH